MPEPSPRTPFYGMLAEFNRAEALTDAARGIKAQGYRRLDAFTPFPLEELTEILGFERDTRVARLALAGGILGALTGFGMQVYTNLAYRIDVGGRPLLSWPAFVLICFELAVLGAVSCAILGMLVLNRLPRLHHPLFGVESFHLATADRFFLLVLGDDALFDPEGTRRALAAFRPVRIDPVAHTEFPS